MSIYVRWRSERLWRRPDVGAVHECVDHALPDGATFDLAYAEAGRDQAGATLVLLPGGPGLASVAPYPLVRRRLAGHGFHLVPSAPMTSDRDFASGFRPRRVRRQLLRDWNTSVPAVTEMLAIPGGGKRISFRLPHVWDDRDGLVSRRARVAQEDRDRGVTHRVEPRATRKSDV